MNIEISIESDLWKNYDNLLELCNTATTKIIKEVQTFYSQALHGEISVVFTDNAHIQKLNAKWRYKNKPTNVLSFPSKTLKIGEKPDYILGDIILAFETIEKEAIEQNKSFLAHLYHLFIHGFLHLLGFDHNTENEAAQMEAIETKILDHLNIKNPY